MGEDARQLRARWDADENQIHKRPPFRAHNFGAGDRYWVVGSTGVSVLHAWNGHQTSAEMIADELNQAGE